MQINLKQTEIEQALRAYVVAQGISLHGKDLTISFTAGRRESGITADITIEDVEIPGYTNAPAVELAEPSPVAQAKVISLAPAAAPVETPAVEVIADAAAADEPVPEVLAEAEPTTEAKATVSLFG